PSRFQVPGRPIVESTNRPRADRHAPLRTRMRSSTGHEPPEGMPHATRGRSTIPAGESIGRPIAPEPMEHLTMATKELVQQSVVGEPQTDASLAWVDDIPEPRRQHLRIWLWSGAALTAATLVVGGITRLTESGLSIVDWAPIVGAIPPLTDEDWQDAFGRYQQYPEYVQLRPNMTLSEFKFIYFWEYIHRMMGRLIGVVFLIPFIWFWIRGYFNGPLIRRALTLFVLGGLQ